MTWLIYLDVAIVPSMAEGAMFFPPAVIRQTYRLLQIDFSAS